MQSIMRQGTLEIVPNVYQITSRGVNVFLIAEEKLTLIDTGFRGTSAKIVDFVHSLGRSAEEISHIIVTHKHFDHAGSLAELRKLTTAKIALHRAEFHDTRKRPSPTPQSKGQRMRPFSALRSALSVKPEDIDIQLAGGELLGGLKVIHTPGHTPGSISLFSARKKLLIVGDALTKYGQTAGLPHRLVTSDRQQAIESVRELGQLDFDILCFGHGRPLTEDVSAKMQQLLAKIKN